MPIDKKIRNSKFEIRNWRFKRGFTLIELLIVISIIAILITIIVATFGTTQDKARDARRREDLDAFKKGLELYKSDTSGSSYYPNCRLGLSCLLSDRTTLVNAASPPTDALTVTYLKDWPRDPSYSTNLDYTYVPAGCTGNNCSSYQIAACLQNVNTPAGTDGVINKPPAPALGSACPSSVTKVYIIANP